MSLEGSQLGHYRLSRQIGSGGMGEIYLAEDTRIARQVAVKVVRNEPASYPDSASIQESTRLFRREMKAVASLDNPHILTLLDFGEELLNSITITYMVMPYRPEGSLNDWMIRRSEKLSLEEINNIIQQAADALQHAHDNGIIHQDVKPSNFLIRGKKDKPNHPDLLLADFGIAKILGATSTASQTSRGTATFMPPEQWDGQPVAATDQYALAVMAYLLLTGRTPFQGRLEQVMRQHFMTEPAAPSTFNPTISADVDKVILHALAKKPEERFASVSNFAFEVQMTITQGDCGGMFFRVDPSTNKFYYYQICQGGGFRLIKYVDYTGKNATDIEDSTSSSINTGLGQSNTIAVVANNANITLYINNQQVYNTQDSSYLDGRLALFATDLNNTTNVSFSNARVWTL